MSIESIKQDILRDYREEEITALNTPKQELTLKEKASPDTVEWGRFNETSDTEYGFDLNGVQWFRKEKQDGTYTIGVVKKYVNYERMARAITHLQYNEFTHSPEYITQAGEVLEVDYPYISKLYQKISGLYLDIPTKDLPHLINNLSRENGYHPIKDMIESQAWDGEERAGRLFIDYLGADDNDYIKWITKKWLVGSVKRIYEEGCKFEIVPILQGKQGIGKSTIASKLGGEWFTDSLKGMGKNKDDYQLIIGSWIVELGELASMNSTETETVKSFISAKEDKVRLPYDRYTKTYKRTVSFIGTSNPSQYLTDFTGNRRFFPIPLKNKATLNVFELNKETIQQIWTEAYELYKEGIQPYVDLTDDYDIEMEQVAEEYRQTATEKGGDIQAVEEYLDMKVPKDWNNYSLPNKRGYYHNYYDGEATQGIEPLDRTTTKEILFVVLGIKNNDRHIGSATKKVNLFMENQDGWKKTTVWMNGKSKKGYKRV